MNGTLIIILHIFQGVYPIIAMFHFPIIYPVSQPLFPLFHLLGFLFIFDNFIFLNFIKQGAVAYFKHPCRMSVVSLRLF